MKPPLRAIQKVHVISATGANIEILGMTTSTLAVGKQSFKVDFLVCNCRGAMNIGCACLF